MFCLTGCSSKTWKGIGFGAATALMVTGSVLETQQNIAHNFDDYVKEHGTPRSSYTSTDGTINYSFIKNCPNSYEQEEILVRVNKENTITQEKTIRSCPTK